MFSPEASLILLACEDNTALAFDTRTGREKFKVPLDSSGEDRNVAFSPDGRLLVTENLDNSADIWATESGINLGTLKGHSKGILSISVSPDSRRIVTTGYKVSQVWDSKTKRELAVLKGHLGYVPFSAFSPDGKRLVPAGEKDGVRVWDARSWNQNFLMEECMWADTKPISFSLDGERIAAVVSGWRGGVWSAQSGRKLFCFPDCMFISFSPDGRRVVISPAGAGYPLRIWHRRRPEYWYGIAWLPEFWLTLAFGLGLA